MSSRSSISPSPAQPCARSDRADDPPRILSRADCEALFHRIVGFRTGTADVTVSIRATWSLTFRWGRNHPTVCGETVEDIATITYGVDGDITAEVTDFDDVSLKATVAALEQRLEQRVAEKPPEPPKNRLGLLTQQRYLEPTLWNDATAQIQPQELSDAVRRSVDPVVDAKRVGAGHAEVGAASWAIFNTRGLCAYAAVTGARYSETVRSVDGNASGWAGKRGMTWASIDATTLSQTASERCLASANPMAIEPGRYTAILSPDVSCLLFSGVVERMDREEAENGVGVFALPPSNDQQRRVSKIGHQVLDARITITSDPTDPECGYMPFDPGGYPYEKVTWVENGVLKNLAYTRAYAHTYLDTDVALPNPLAFRVSGGETSVEEMIATTERGIMVNRCGYMDVEDPDTLSLTALTRDGLFLIEQGKITHAVKNMWFTESPLIVFNKILQIGRPVLTHGIQNFASSWGGEGVLRDLPARAVCDGSIAVVVPPIKVEDFTFTRLSDAV